MTKKRRKKSSVLNTTEKMKDRNYKTVNTNSTITFRDATNRVAHARNNSVLSLVR